MNVSSFCAIDTETSGLNSAARILEVAAVTFECGKPVREYSQLICPEAMDWKLAEQALAVNKLTPEQLHGKPTFERIRPDLMVELAHPVLVAHNMDFDARMIRQEHERLGCEFKPESLMICTKELAAYLEPDAPGNKLFEVAARYGVKQEDAHRAHVDATVCGNILVAMLEQFPDLPRSIDGMRETCRKAHAQWTKKGYRR